MCLNKQRRGSKMEKNESQGRGHYLERKQIFRVLRSVFVFYQNSGCGWGDAEDEGEKTGKQEKGKGLQGREGRMRTADWLYLICLE